MLQCLAHYQNYVSDKIILNKTLSADIYTIFTKSYKTYKMSRKQSRRSSFELQYSSQGLDFVNVALPVSAKLGKLNTMRFKNVILFA